MKKNKKMRREHWKKKIYDQEDINFLLHTPPLQSIYLTRKQQEVNRIDTVGYKNTERKYFTNLFYPRKKNTEEENFIIKNERIVEQIKPLDTF